jgi:hypothetical protein
MPNDSHPRGPTKRTKGRWKIVDKKLITLNSVGRGQEFVLDIEQYSGIKNWLRKLFS